VSRGGLRDTGVGTDGRMWVSAGAHDMLTMVTVMMVMVMMVVVVVVRMSVRMMSGC